MKRYIIKNASSGNVFGIYQAADRDDALDCYARDAGYRDYAEACRVAPHAPIVADVVDED